jgi:hypothetical protein
MGYRAAEHTVVSPDGEEADRGVKLLNSRDRFVRRNAIRMFQFAPETHPSLPLIAISTTI